jgi:FAD/FMN-containing dehydrogenase
MSSAEETFRREFGGAVIGPGDEEYAAASRCVFAVGSPAYVVRPGSVPDVQAAVRFAARAGLAPAVRGGGHGFQGFATNDGGVVIDLADVDEVEVVDERRHIVRIGGGATWGRVADALAPHGLAISSGDTRSVGVGGLTLGGGIGWKVRRYGLALDQLVGAELVLADGESVRADAEQHPDLFWALRGGGGNLGIVTAFDFRAHPATDVFHGRVTFPAAQAAGVLRGWAEHLRSAPDELSSVVNLANPFAGGPEAPVEVVVVVDSDDAARAAELVDPIRRLGPVIDDDVTRTPYAATLVEGMVPPPGIRFVPRSAFVDEESVPQALDVLAEVATSPGAPVVSVRSLGGAVSRVPDDATAYAHRSAELMVVTVSAGPEPVVAAAAPALEAVWERLAPHVHGAYANFLSAATEQELAAIYPVETHGRLVAVKERYDPENLFAGNHNVRPRTAGRPLAG